MTRLFTSRQLDCALELVRQCGEEFEVTGFGVSNGKSDRSFSVALRFAVNKLSRGVFEEWIVEYYQRLHERNAGVQAFTLVRRRRPRVTFTFDFDEIEKAEDDEDNDSSAVCAAPRPRKPAPGTHADAELTGITVLAYRLAVGTIEGPTFVQCGLSLDVSDRTRLVNQASVKLFELYLAGHEPEQYQLEAIGKIEDSLPSESDTQDYFDLRFYDDGIRGMSND